MNVEEIKQCVREGRYVYSQHAENRRVHCELTFVQVEEALLDGQILEQYPDTGRGESCLLTGYSGDIPIHVVCGWRGNRVVIITLYIPQPPKFIDPWTRGE